MSSQSGSEDRPRGNAVSLEVPVLTLVLAFTAIPLGLRRPSVDILLASLQRGVGTIDVLANVIGYVPVGMVLAHRGIARAVGLGTCVSLFAEISQVVAEGRFPSYGDLATNALGTAIGAVASRALRLMWSRERPYMVAGRVVSVMASVVAIAMVWLLPQITPRRMTGALTRVFAAAPAGFPVDPRGVTSPGRLEGHWNFDEEMDDTVLDASGNNARARLVHGSALGTGALGRALRLNGVDQFAEVGGRNDLHFTGSVTVSAWVNVATLPEGNVAIVSNRRRFGYQLDATTDQGPMRFAFKLSDDRGRLMAQYGQTRVKTNSWYHVAGVFDARATTLDLFVNGHRENGCHVGTISRRQWPSSEPTYVGRSARVPTFYFDGRIDDVRIYSRALSAEEIRTLVVEGTRTSQFKTDSTSAGSSASDHACSPTGTADTTLPGMFVTLGVLFGFATLGLSPPAYFRSIAIGVALVAGVLITPLMPPTLGIEYRFVIPLLTLLGSISVVVSAHAD